MPTIQQLMNDENYLTGLETNNPSGGVNYDFYRNLFGGMLQKGDPNMAQYRQNLYGNINASTNTQQTKLKEMLAGTGLLRSGSATSAALGLEAGRANALANAETQLSQQDTDYKNKAIANLLGIEQMGIGELQGNRSYAMGLRGLVENQRNRDLQLKLKQMEIDAQNEDDGWFGNLLGGLVGTFGGSYLGGLGKKLAGG